MSFRVDITIDHERVQQLFQRLMDAGENLSPIMADLAEGLLHRTEDRFDTQTAPDGSKWAPLTPRYAKRKSKKGYTGPLLVRERKLRGELRPDWGADFAEVATANVAYAAIHQFGGQAGMAPGPAAIPAREYMGLAEDDLAWIEETVADHFDRIAGLA
ncbi:phage virion morphogenesis protein [Lysobacter sp. CA199]|uniref:phage virion morphogenesis protein n=1 Tax=Lysobacter sp. CA199 TaxID=3455608 RepID=UPI003F8D5E9A